MTFTNVGFLTGDGTDYPDRIQLGDRVKLTGPNQHAGETGIYFASRFNGLLKYHVVRLDGSGDETIVADPEAEMRKI
jgi:hypothetical protein